MTVSKSSKEPCGLVIEVRTDLHNLREEVMQDRKRLNGNLEDQWSAINAIRDVLAKDIPKKFEEIKDEVKKRPSWAVSMIITILVAFLSIAVTIIAFLYRG